MPWKNWKTLTKIPWRYHDQFCPWSKIQPPNSLTILRNWKAVMKIATSWYLQGIWMVFRIVFEVLIKIDEVFGRFDISKILKILSNHIFEFWDFGLVDFAKWSSVLSLRWSFHTFSKLRATLGTLHPCPGAPVWSQSQNHLTTIRYTSHEAMVKKKLKFCPHSSDITLNWRFMRNLNFQDHWI